MSALHITDPIGEIAARSPWLSRVFERTGLDYCCGGKKTLEEACREKGIDPERLVDLLQRAQPADDVVSGVDAAVMSLTELADHIEQTHHTYLRSELPRLDRMTEKVASAHGAKDSRLHQVRATVLGLAEELFSHMMKEERVLFPMVRELEASEKAPRSHCGTLAHPIRQMEREHDQAGSALERLRELTDGYTSPDWACNTYRALLDALAHLERDMHQHVHKENNVLFPRALKLERHRDEIRRKGQETDRIAPC